MHEKKLLPIAQSNGCGPSCSNNDAKLPFGLVEPYTIERSGPSESIFIEPFHSVPENVHIEITYACMEDCIMCYNPTRTKVNARDKALVWEVIRSIAESRVPHTYLIGGEPTYGYSKSELQDMVEYLSDNGSSVTIVSNGQITLKNMTSRLACYGVSLHGSDPDTHDSITRTKGSFNKAIRSIREYVEEGHDVRIIPVVMGINHSQMYSLAELAFTFQPLRRFFERATDKVFFRDKYDPQVVLNNIGHILASEIRIQQLAKNITLSITSQMKITKADIVVIDDEQIFYQTRPIVGQRHELGPRELHKLAKSVIVADELSSGE